MRLCGKKALNALFAWCMAVFACGFSSREWLEKRNDETERLRLMEAFARLDAAKGRPAEGVSLPLERFENGAVKTTLSADFAWIFPDEPFVIAKDVFIKRMKEDGQSEIELSASLVIADRKTKTVWVEGHASIKADQANATGSGIYFSFEDDMLRVYHGTRITTKALNLKMENLLP